MAITQWNPTHTAICRIRGIEPFAFASWHDLDQKFSLLKVFTRPHHYFDYGFRGGSFDLRTFTLDQFYHKHLLGWNTWSRSNEGFDLGRYFGTTLTFYPHLHIPYIVFWERNWEETEFERLPKMHPFYLLVHKRNTKIILPRSMGGKKKKIRIRPPSLQTSHWFYQASWVATALFRVGMSPLNLESPFVHKPGPNQQPIYAPWIGYADPPTSTVKIPLPVKWSGETFKGPTHKWDKILYRWWWDTGDNNYILANPKMIDPSNAANNMLEVIPIYYPYYMFFYGAMLPTGKDTVEANTDLPGKTPVIIGSQNPTPIAIWWYYDRGVYWDPDRQHLHMDNRYLRPEDIPTYLQGRTWVYLYDGTNFGTGVQFEDAALKTSWTTQQVQTRIQAIVENSPFVIGKFDIPFQNKEENFVMKYRSDWQWGGHIPKPDNIKDPETLADRNPPQSSVRNPATVGFATLHPWDISQGGTISDQKLKAIISNILTPPGPARPDASRPASPEQHHHKHHHKKRKRPRPRSPSPSESEESDELPSSETSSEQRWESQSPSSTETEEESPPPSKKSHLVLQRQFRLRK